jgi:hypothetical protein
MPAKGNPMNHRIPMLAFLAALTLPAAAQAQAQGQEVFRQYCTGDYMRLCSQFSPESREVRQCFIANMRSLSPGCQSVIAAQQPARKQRRKKRRR